MLIASNISGFGFGGLGAFQQGQCADGADFVCGPKTSKGVTVNSCRPCDFAQLEAFRELQERANSLVVALGMEKSPAIITGPDSCGGGDILALDGRVGPCTTRTVARIIQIFGPRKLAASDPLLRPSNFQPTKEYVAHALPEIVSYLRQLVTLTNAPKNVPAPAQQPIKTVSGGPGAGSGEFPTTIVPGLTPKPKTGASLKVTIGILGALAAVGLVGTGVYYYRTQY
jgi:hypothetical protein